MAPLFLGGGNASSAKYFQIRLDQSSLILRGEPDESPSALLKGTLVLCLSEPLKVQGIHLRFTGEAKVDFPCLPIRNGVTRKLQETEILKKCWDFVKPEKGHTVTLPAGNYEYPFQYIVPGNVPESLEGLKNGWIIYRLKATIERGRFAKDVYARKHVRVIRTFDPSALELAHNMSVESVWPNKIAYNISTLSKASIFGTNVQLDFKIIPLLKGLKIGKIECFLFERQDFEVEQEALSDKYYQVSRVVAEDVWELDEDVETEDIDGQDGYVFSRCLQLPKNLKDCVQSIDTHGIKVKHQIKFVVGLLNPPHPGGHKSELKAALPVQIFISPNMPLNDNNEIVSQSPTQVSTLTTMANAPPTYGEHSFDQLYSDVDPSGYMTPGATSGFSTPFAQSRRGSHEDMTSIGAGTDSELVANTLHNRLHSLQNLAFGHRTRQRSTPSGHATPAYGSIDATPDPDHSSRASSIPHISYFPRQDGSSSRGSHSNPLSRRGSDEHPGSSAPMTPQHVEYNNDDLCKVPSYNTALQGPLPTPYSKDLPNYRTAISRPPSPPPPMPQVPGAVHVGSGGVDSASSSTTLHPGDYGRQG